MISLDYLQQCPFKYKFDSRKAIFFGKHLLKNNLYHLSEMVVEPPHIVLYGHRSIVNQVRYNPHYCLIASSGVEKIIKVCLCFIYFFIFYFYLIIIDCINVTSKASRVSNKYPVWLLNLTGHKPSIAE